MALDNLTQIHNKTEELRTAEDSKREKLLGETAQLVEQANTAATTAEELRSLSKKIDSLLAVTATFEESEKLAELREAMSTSRSQLQNLRQEVEAGGMGKFQKFLSGIGETFAGTSGFIIEKFESVWNMVDDLGNTLAFSGAGKAIGKIFGESQERGLFQWFISREKVLLADELKKKDFVGIHSIAGQRIDQLLDVFEDDRNPIKKLTNFFARTAEEAKKMFPSLDRVSFTDLTIAAKTLLVESTPPKEEATPEASA